MTRELTVPGSPPPAAEPSVAVVGGGPAGLMAAEVLAQAGLAVDLFDAMPSVGRKFLLAGKGGLNLTHSEPLPDFVARYGPRQAEVGSWLAAFGPEALRAWAAALGVATFVGTSGRVFPHEMKAAPLLRAWLQRLRAAGVRLHMRHRWAGWAEEGVLRFETPQGPVAHRADAVVLALGGASWARLGSDGAWTAALRDAGADVVPLRSANCGFDVGWSAHFARHFAGQPIKPVVLRHGIAFDRRGEFIVTQGGIEGSLVYAASAAIRDEIGAQGTSTISLDLLPDRTAEHLACELARPRGRRTLTKHLHDRAGLQGVKAALLREALSGAELLALVDTAPADLARRLKAWPLRLTGTRPIDEAISSAGGVRLESLDEHLMLRARPGVFCAGEMLDWEAPTGGYLLTACFASGRVAAAGAARWLRARAALDAAPLPHG